MFSPLARGVGTWTGGIHTRDDICPEDVLPLLPIDQDYHPHGITISPRLYSAATKAQPSEKSNGELVLPKTFITRKGALMLFTAPNDFDELLEDDNLYLKKAHRFLRTHYAEQIAKLGNLSRLAQSILMFGDENYSKEDTSISDADNKIILKFLHELDTDHCDKKSKPGSDLSIYLRDLRSRRSSARSSFSPADGRKSSQSFLIPSRETTTLSADAQSLVSQLRPNSATDDKASIVSSCRPTHRVLSADKLRASLKSNSYLGRPSPTPAPLDEERVIYPYTPPVSRRSSATSITYKHSTPLLEHRHRSRTAVDGIESISGREHVQRYLEDIQSEGIGEESIVEIPSSRGDLLPDDLQAEEYEEYDDDELELFEEQSFDETPTATQPLIPLYNNTRQVSNGKFSIGDAEAAYNTNGNITVEQANDGVTGHLSDVDQCLRESPEVMQDLDDDDDDDDDNDVVGVTAVDIINSHRGSDTSSHSGFPSDDVCSEVVENIPAVGSLRIRSARGQRVRSAVGHRVQSSKGRRIHSAAGEREADQLEEESVDVIVDAPPAPPGTRTASPTAIQDDGSEAFKESTTVPGAAEPDTTGSDLIGHGASEPDMNEPDTTEPDMAAADEQVFDIRKLEKPKSGLLAGEQEPDKQHLMTSTDDAKQIEISSGDMVDVLKSDFVHGTSPLITNETVSKPKTDHVTKKADPLAEHPDQVKDPSMEADEMNTQKATPDDGETKVIDVVKDKKVKNVVKAKEKSKVKNVSGTKEPSKEVSKVKQTTKQYSKPLDVTQIASPKKKTPEKKEPLLQGLESYVTNTKDAPKKADQGKKLEVKVQPKHDTSGSNLIPSPPPKSKEEMALDQIEKEDIYSKWRRKPKRHHSVTEILGNKTKDTGFSAEEMAIEQQLLQERLEAAQQKVKGEPSSSPPPKRSTRNKKEPKKGKKEKDKKDDKNNEDLTKQRDALREARRLEKMKRLEDAKKLEEQIKEKEEAKRQSEAESDRKAQALKEQIEMIAREAAEARQLEEEAQQQMAAQRRKAREEREGRRKADLERKKREAAKHREHEKKMMEAAKAKERQMLARITDAEHRRMIEEEDRKRREEEELFEEQEKEAEEQELERLAEEEEEKLRELERQAEEEALAFLSREREEAEARQRALMEQVAWEEHQQELQSCEYDTDMKQIEGEKAKLEEQMRKQQEEEMSKFEEEKKRYEELQNIEQAALECLRQEMEQKRIAALRRRELNLERRKHLNKLAHGQGMTRPWVFTYYVHWPRETYEKRMGQDPKKKGSKSLKKPKPRQ